MNFWNNPRRELGAIKQIVTLAERSSRDRDAGSFDLRRPVGARLFNVSSMHQGWGSRQAAVRSILGILSALMALLS